MIIVIYYTLRFIVLVVGRPTGTNLPIDLSDQIPLELLGYMILHLLAEEFEQFHLAASWSRAVPM